jgi:hypothetical protein
MSIAAVWAVFFEGASLPLGSAAATVGAYLGAAEVWAIVSGSVGLYGIFRRRGQISRNGCLLLGALGGLAFLPATFIASNVLLLPAEALSTTGASIGAVAVFGFCGLPFGALGGWILWRIAVRPAVAPMSDISQIFD